MPRSVAFCLMRWLGAAALLVLAGCVGEPIGAVQATPPPAGTARLWFYRIFDPSLSLNTANVDLNGVRAVSVPPHSHAIYLDVPPGPYHLSPESYGTDTNQTRDLVLAPGQEVYVKVLDDPTWMSSGDTTDIRRDTFYVWVMPPALARAEMAMPM